jgi:hypothetical protein
VRKNFQIFADHIAPRLDDVTGINEQDVIGGEIAKQFEVQVLDRSGNDRDLVEQSVGAQSLARARINRDQLPAASLAAIGLEGSS